MDIPADIAAQMAIAKQNVALSLIKRNAQAEQQVAAILEQAVQNVPTSPVRGSHFNRFA